MPLMPWTEKLGVGVTVLDDDHKRLVGMLNELYDAMQAGRGKETLGRILDGLVQYTTPKCILAARKNSLRRPAIRLRLRTSRSTTP